MKVCGVIAEFNPLHNGHEYLLKQAREITNADYLLVVMSGDYVQRGEPAIVDKYCRTKMALRAGSVSDDLACSDSNSGIDANAGADLVLELPVPYATGSAQYFARAAIAALAHTGVVDTLCFGSESGELNILRDLASSIPQPSSASRLFKDDPSAKTSSGSTTHSGRFTTSDERLQPNDLLAVEYLRALSSLNLNTIAPHAVRRIGAGYHDTKPEGNCASASYLRSCLLTQTSAASSASPGMPATALTDSYHDLPDHLPARAITLLTAYAVDARFLSLPDFSPQLAYKLLSERDRGYTAYFDVFDDLSEKIQNHLEEYRDIPSFLSLLKSKDIAYSHLSRALLHILLDIRTEEVNFLCDRYDYCPWLRPIGFLRSASPLLRAIRANADRPFLSKLADSGRLLDEKALPLLEHDLSASELYAHNAKKKGGIPSEYRHPLILL